MTNSGPALVIGGNGFIGLHLVDQLISSKQPVKTLDLGPGRRSQQGIESYSGSYLQTEILREAMIGVDTVYHLAATRMPREADLDPKEDCMENVVGMLGLLDVALETGVSRVVFSSSGGTVYGPTDHVPIVEDHPTNPISAYGVSKLACERYLRLYSGRGKLKPLSTISLRIANPYGPHQNIKKAQGALSTFCHNAVAGKKSVIWGDGSVERDFIHVNDVARALQLAGMSDVSGTEINIGSGTGSSLNSILEIIDSTMGTDPNREYVSGRSFDVQKNYLDISRAKSLLGWEPHISLEEGIEELISYLRAEVEANS